MVWNLQQRRLIVAAAAAAGVVVIGLVGSGSSAAVGSLALLVLAPIPGGAPLERGHADGAGRL